MEITTRPLWRLRLVERLPRCLLYATCAFGLLASARFAIAPPRTVSAVIEAQGRAQPDLAARGYAVLFARRYLAWDAAASQPSGEALASMAGSAIEPDAGLSPPPNGSQRVLWAEVVQERTPASGRHVYTIAAQTDTSGLVYMTVTVVRDAEGRVAVAGYPAFVGAPLSAIAQPAQAGAEVADPALSTIVERALRNYLAGAQQELAADLADGAQIALPALHLTLESMQRLVWSSDRRSVVALVEAQDERGARYTLDYEADVEEVHERWEISAIQTNPTE
ncbi:MAG TPA: conjugal transfer protein [Solirubrobacteraceae bacterium]|nr:conjugal transfer protein [Solirubrobacteraceae bacterium]